MHRRKKDKPERGGFARYLLRTHVGEYPEPEKRRKKPWWRRK